LLAIAREWAMQRDEIEASLSDLRRELERLSESGAAAQEHSLAQFVLSREALLAMNHGIEREWIEGQLRNLATSFDVAAPAYICENRRAHRKHEERIKDAPAE
jgi:hypothetical protein